MKRDWSDGYVADIGYSHGYFHELAPGHLRFHLLVNGRACPSDGGSYTYCELGYGQGVSANIHAAANPRGEFWGTDFNPDHVLHARALARQAGLGAQWLDHSFEALLDAATPAFDFIVLHGVWSWVSPAAQHALVEFMRRKLKPGGVVYVSYNVLPGWNAERPLRDLLWLHTEHGSAPGASTPARIASALSYARALRRHGCTFFTDNLRASQALDDMLRQDPGELAHEYFNRSWVLSYFADMERALQAASLEFACSVHLSDVAGEVHERLAGAGFLEPGLGTPLRETTADFVLNRRFRRDVFTRGALRLSHDERLAALDAVKFTLLRPADTVSMFLSTPYSQTALDETRIRPVLDLLDASAQPLSFAALRTDPALASQPLEQLLLTLSQLVARRDACPVFADDAARMREARAPALNQALARRRQDAVRYLASPVAGSGVDADPWQQAFWLAWQDGARTAAELARAVSAGCDDDAESREEVERQAEGFVQRSVPLWRRLGLVDQRAKARK